MAAKDVLDIAGYVRQLLINLDGACRPDLLWFDSHRGSSSARQALERKADILAEALKQFQEGA